MLLEWGLTLRYMSLYQGLTVAITNYLICHLLAHHLPQRAMPLRRPAAARTTIGKRRAPKQPNGIVAEAAVAAGELIFQEDPLVCAQAWETDGGSGIGHGCQVDDGWAMVVHGRVFNVNMMQAVLAKKPDTLSVLV